jgi:hypothetical protein
MNALLNYPSAALTVLRSIMDNMPCSQLRLIGHPVYQIPLHPPLEKGDNMKPLFGKEGQGEIFKIHKAVQHVLPLTRA